MASKPRVVIVGGGYGGIAVAKALDAVTFVTLIEQKKQFFHNVAATRASVDASWIRKTFIPYDRLLKHGKVIQGTVTEVSEKIVKYKKIEGEEETIEFDYLIIALGTETSFPAKSLPNVDRTKELLEKNTENIKAAEKIIIVGAGAVGLELAGEIAYYHPKKKVTIIHSSDKVISTSKGLNPKFREKVMQNLKELNIQIVLNEKVLIDAHGQQQQREEGEAKDKEKKEGEEKKTLELQPQGEESLIPTLGKYTLKTDKGHEYDADLVFFCTGVSSNNKPLLAHFQEKLENGRIKVNQFLQVEGYTNIFAIGDITNIPEPKLAYVAGLHASKIANNIKVLIKGGKNLKAHKPVGDGMMLPLGKERGVSQFPGMTAVAGSFVTKTVKGKSLFVPRFWGELNYKYSDK